MTKAKTKRLLKQFEPDAIIYIMDWQTITFYTPKMFEALYEILPKHKDYRIVHAQEVWGC